MLELREVRKTFNPGTPSAVTALAGVSASFRPGEFVTIVGNNGSGKSTLLNIIAGNIAPDSGTIRFNDRDLVGVPEHRRAGFIGRVHQQPGTGTAPAMTVAENLLLARLRGRQAGLRTGITAVHRTEFAGLVERLGGDFSKRLDDRTATLSGGQRQLLTVLMAAAGRPEILLLDEHAASLDPVLADRVLNFTNELVRECGALTLMVTHNLADALRFGDRLLMMSGGRIILDCGADEKGKLTEFELIRRFRELSGASLSDTAVLPGTNR